LYLILQPAFRLAAVLGTNIASIFASKNLQASQSNMANSVERLSSGLRINRAKDDAAGLAISNLLTQQINGANQGIKNLNDGVSVVQTADGALSTVNEMANRILTLATQAKSDFLSSDQIDSIKAEATTLITEIGNIQARTAMNGMTLFGGKDLSIGSSKESKDAISITKESLADFTDSTEAKAVDAAITALTAGDAGDKAQALITAAEDYITAIGAQRAELGAIQNQMDYAISNVTQLSADLTAARSRVIDTDYAAETASLTKGQILQQAATAMLAQANQMPNVILSLLK